MGGQDETPKNVYVLPEITITPEDKDNQTSAEAMADESKERGDAMIAAHAEGAQEREQALTEERAYAQLKGRPDEDLQQLITYAENNKSNSDAQLMARVATRILREKRTIASKSLWGRIFG